MCLVTQSWPTLWGPIDFSPQGSSVHGDSPGKNTGVSCHVPLQGTFPTQGWNLSLPHCRRILYRWQCMVLKTKATIYLQVSLREVDHQLEKLSSVSFWLSHVYVPSPGLNFLIYINKLLELNQMLRRSFLALLIYFSHTNTYRHFLCITHDTSTNGVSLCKGSCCWRAFNHPLYSYLHTHTHGCLYQDYSYTQVKHMHLVLILI